MTIVYSNAVVDIVVVIVVLDVLVLVLFLVLVFVLDIFVVVVVVVVFVVAVVVSLLLHHAIASDRHYHVRGHRTGSRHSGMESLTHGAISGGFKRAAGGFASDQVLSRPPSNSSRGLPLRALLPGRASSFSLLLLLPMAASAVLTSCHNDP